jgi:hypothetical protein
MGKRKKKMPDGWEERIRLGDTGLLIDVGLQGDGATYVLDPSAQKHLDGVPSSTPRPRSVFIGHHRDSEFESIHAPHWSRVAEMLTGMTLEQLRPFAPIRIYSPQQVRVVWEWKPEEITTCR